MGNREPRPQQFDSLLAEHTARELWLIDDPQQRALEAGYVMATAALILVEANEQVLGTKKD